MNRYLVAPLLAVIALGVVAPAASGPATPTLAASGLATSGLATPTLATPTLAASAPAVSGPATSGPAGSAGARVTAPAGELRVGQRVLVGLAGWPVGTVQVEVCGNDGQRGALDCATGAATHGQVAGSGTALLPMTLAAPPVACPCQLRARTPTGSVVASVALPLAGVVAPPAPTPAAPARLSVVALRVDDRTGLGGWFALPDELTVYLSLRNDGASAVLDPAMSLLAGRPGRVHTIVAAPGLGTVAAGETREYRLRIPVAAGTIGHYDVDGRIEASGRPLLFTVRAARYPWGLLVLAGALLAVVAFRVARRRPVPPGGPPAAVAEQRRPAAS